MQEEPLEHVTELAEFPPIQPQTFTSTELLLNSSAGFTGTKVGAGDHAAALYILVALGPVQGSAWDIPSTADNSSDSDAEGIVYRQRQI
jgi:hypothetical protein